MKPNQLSSNATASPHYWSGGAGLNRSSITLLLGMEGLEPFTWQAQAGDIYHLQTQPYWRILWVAVGSLEVHLPQLEQTFILQPGDRLDLPPWVGHHFVVGPTGVMCVEARRAE